jgi:hypothetical protein
METNKKAESQNKDSAHFSNMHELEAFIGKASKGEVVVLSSRILGNVAYGSLRLALWAKFNKKMNSFPLIYI